MTLSIYVIRILKQKYNLPFREKAVKSGLLNLVIINFLLSCKAKL